MIPQSYSVSTAAPASNPLSFTAASGASAVDCKPGAEAEERREVVRVQVHGVREHHRREAEEDPLNRQRDVAARETSPASEKQQRRPG